jgi:hypothetical protein
MKDLNMRVKLAGAGSNVALRADLLFRLNRVSGFNYLRLRMKDFNGITGGLLRSWIPLFNHDATHFRLYLSYVAIHWRCYRTMRRDAPASAHINADVWTRSCTSRSAELARWSGLMTVLGRFYEIDQSLDNRINCHSSIRSFICDSRHERPPQLPAIFQHERSELEHLRPKD